MRQGDRIGNSTRHTSRSWGSRRAPWSVCAWRSRLTACAAWNRRPHDAREGDHSHEGQDDVEDPLGEQGGGDQHNAPMAVTRA